MINSFEDAYIAGFWVIWIVYVVVVSEFRLEFLVIEVVCIVDGVVICIEIPDVKA